jgi:hypothetical protein
VQLRPSTPTVVVTMDDGTVLSCTPQQIGGPEGRVRWVIADTAGREHAGPPYLGFTSQNDVHRLICEWWAAKRA